MNINELWIGKTGNANAWYHIFPFVESKYTNRITIVRKDPLARKIESTKLTTIHFSSVSYLNELWNYFWIGYKTLKNNDIDLVISFSLVPWGIISWILAKLNRKKIILGLIGSDFNKHIKKGVFSPVLKYILRKSDFITVTGNQMRNELLALIDCEKKIDVFPHCLPDDLMQNGQYQWGKMNYLITVSELTKDKRTIDIIKAIELLKQQNINVKLFVVGNGTMELSLKKYVKENDLTDNIIFKGYIDEIKEMYLKASIFVQASLNEGLSLCLVEAIGMELIPIITNAGSEKDIIRDKENGLFFKKMNVEDLAEKIKYTMKEDNFKKLLNGVRISKKYLNIDVAINKVENIQEKLFLNN